MRQSRRHLKFEKTGDRAGDEMEEIGQHEADKRA